mmetsp:Transcript_99889/g.258109  ORF Transcript_99889/g.258109 Transcript_99889/m.258109 type:complete len:214 (+) Transcript_99889:757-1398(+)
MRVQQLVRHNLGRERLRLRHHPLARACVGNPVQREVCQEERTIQEPQLARGEDRRPMLSVLRVVGAHLYAFLLHTAHRVIGGGAGGPSVVVAAVRSHHGAAVAGRHAGQPHAAVQERWAIWTWSTWGQLCGRSRVLSISRPGTVQLEAGPELCAAVLHVVIVRMIDPAVEHSGDGHRHGHEEDLQRLDQRHAAGSDGELVWPREDRGGEDLAA